MSDEAEIGSAGASDRRGHPRGSPGEQSPLQTRAAFLKNWSWQLVVSLNRGACSRGSAQYGVNRETQEACAREWEEKRPQVCSLAEAIEFLRQCHRRAPFLFFKVKLPARSSASNPARCFFSPRRAATGSRS